MPIDARITQAINEAVEEAGQPKGLARRLIAWFEAVTTGIEDINDVPTAARHLEVLFEGTVVEGDDEEDKV